MKARKHSSAGMRFLAWTIMTLFGAFVVISLIGGIYEATHRSPGHTLGMIGVMVLMIAAIWAHDYLNRPRQ